LPDPYWIGAQVACVTANANRGKGPPLKIEDFIPRMRPAGRRQSAEEQMAAFRAIDAARKDR
jgi:hypothetical protein